MVGEIRTLVVADDPAMRRLVRMRLEAAGGFRVIGEGTDGAAAIELADRYRPDLLLLDATTPRTDGLEALPGVTAASPHTRVVLLTGHAAQDLVERARELGAADVVDKTAGLDALIARLAADGVPQSAPTGEAAVYQEALRQSEDSYRALVDAVKDYAIFMLDVDGTIVSWNPGAARIEGYTADEIIGRHFRTFYPLEMRRERHPEHELELALRDGHYEEEGWRIRKDGSRFWANVLITAVFNGAGNHIGFAKVTRDIDERRQMLIDLEDAGAALADVNRELATANEQLRAKAEEQAEFLAVTAHELRNPVSVLSGSATLLVQHWAELDDRDRDELVGSVTSTAQRLERLLADLLTASRLESDAIALRPEDVDLGALLASSVAAARTDTPTPDVRLDADAGLSVTGDPGRLAQAVDNLVANALRYGAQPVCVSAHADGDQVVITVSDAGQGVPADLVPRLFERFASGRHRGGTGLGLFIVRELARAHGGDAWYAPGPTGGACFGLSLPAARSAADTLEPRFTTVAPKQA